MIRKRVLIVTPYFPPANGADAHRVRVTLPFFQVNGWDAEVLAVNPDCLAVPRDPWLSGGIPGHIAVHRCNALSLRWSRIPGLGILDFRVFGAVRKCGDQLLRTQQFDLVYFSTTVMSLTSLGPRWKARFGVPFIVDYQDPWFTDYYKRNPTVSPPGGRLKYSIMNRLSRWQEPRMLRSCSAITAVSPAYPEQLAERYAFAASLPNMVAPFPGAKRDFDRIVDEAISQDIFDAGDGYTHWVYVGVSGAIMHKTLGAFFEALCRARKQGLGWMEKLRLHFIGTSYAPPGRGTPFVRPLADQFGVGDLVEEQTDRIPYSTALRCLLDADALLAFGSNDATYNASKLLPYLMASKPLLAVFHGASPAATLLTNTAGATLIAFDENDEHLTLVNRILANWIHSDAHTMVVPLSPDHTEMYTDTGQAKILCNFFDTVIATKRVERGCLQQQ